MYPTVIGYATYRGTELQTLDFLWCGYLWSRLKYLLGNYMYVTFSKDHHNAYQKYRATGFTVFMFCGHPNLN